MAKVIKQSEAPMQLAVINQNTAAIDIGSMLMMVSFTDADGKNYLIETDGFTESINELARTLKQASVTHVAMEATGVYWMALYDVLEKHGLIVTLINPRHFKNVDAQKTDVKDCQWIHQMHAHGLLKASHIAPEVYRELKTYLHEREVMQKQKSDTLNRIHRQLTLMNIKVQHLISDIEGVSGMKLIRGIATGEQDPAVLLSLIDVGKLKATEEELLESLKGLYKKQHVTVLNRLLRAYDFFKDEMKQYESLVKEVLDKMLPVDEQGKKPVIKKKTAHVRKNQYSINLKGYLENILGTDATAIEGLDEISILTIIAVTGIDMSKWRTAEHFVSWLNLCARPKISGGKTLGHQKRFTNNAATQAFRIAAQAMWNNKGPLGHFYRRMATRDSGKAVKAVARKLAIIFYNVVKNKSEYDRSKLERNEEQRKRQQINRLKKMASNYGFELQEVRTTSL
jgi:transposase